MEINIKINKDETGAMNVKLSLDVDLQLTTALVGLESAKNQVIELFANYCDENGIKCDKQAFQEYEKMKVGDLHKKS